MTPGARVAAVIELLERFALDGAPADRILAAWGRANRYAGSKDRAAIADRFYRCLRRRRSLCLWRGDESARACVIGDALAQGEPLDALFGASRHAPDALSDAESAALQSPIGSEADDPRRLDYPDWLDGSLRESLGARFESCMTALQDRAPLDLRVNRLKTDRESAAQALAAEGIETEIVAAAPDCLRAAQGAAIARSDAYLRGLVELQDAASQRAAAAACAQPGEVVVDFCAGGGGKTLALAAEMGGEGRLIAHDASPRRMADLPARAARAGARIEVADSGALKALWGACDLVFVDAPCSGSGAWRRDPGGKWRLSPERLAALVDTQTRILAEARTLLKPGGRLAYATCSILRCEEAAFHALTDATPHHTERLRPDAGCDGFFIGVASME